MGRTTCTEPQCLYKGALYLFYLLKYTFLPAPANLLLDQGHILQSMVFNDLMKTYWGVEVRLHTFVNYIRIVASYLGQIISEGIHV